MRSLVGANLNRLSSLEVAGCGQLFELELPRVETADGLMVHDNRVDDLVDQLGGPDAVAVVTGDNGACGPGIGRSTTPFTYLETAPARSDPFSETMLPPGH